VAQGTQVQSAGLLLVMLVVLVVLVVLPAVESAQERHLLVVVMVETKVHRPKQEPPIQEVGNGGSGIVILKYLVPVGTTVTHIYKGSGSWVAPEGVTAIDWLIVAGGGGSGGDYGGGGGAGGL
jgi:hypothetical protein